MTVQGVIEVGKVTIQDLKEYRKKLIDLRSIEAEIESLYYPISSPPTQKNDSGKSSVRLAGDPTLSSVVMIEQRKEELREQKHILNQEMIRIQLFVDQIDDAELRGIIRVHYLVGESWKNTSRLIYGKNEEANARIYFQRKKNTIL